MGRPRGGREGRLCWIQRVPTPTPPPYPVPEVLLDGLQLAHPLRSIRDTILSCLPWGREEGTGLRAGASPSHICMRTQPRKRTGLGWHAPSSGANFTCTCMHKDLEQHCPWNLLPRRKGHLFTPPNKAAGTSGVVVPEHIRRGSGNGRTDFFTLVQV